MPRRLARDAHEVHVILDRVARRLLRGLEERADVIVKGLRVVSDFESEMSAAMMNRSLSDVDTLFLMSDQKYSFVSSSLVKEVFFLGGDVAALVPEPVLRVMAEKRKNLQRR